MKTVPLRQWLVERELRKRITRLVAERGIDMAAPPVAVSVPRDPGR